MTEFSGKTQISLRIPPEMMEMFDKIANALERDRTWVMLRAFRQYLDDEGAGILREAEGVASLDRGEGIDFDQLMDEVDSIIAEAEAARSTAGR